MKKIDLKNITALVIIIVGVFNIIYCYNHLDVRQVVEQKQSLFIEANSVLSNSDYLTEDAKKDLMNNISSMSEEFYSPNEYQLKVYQSVIYAELTLAILWIIGGIMLLFPNKHHSPIVYFIVGLSILNSITLAILTIGFPPITMILDISFLSTVFSIIIDLIILWIMIGLIKKTVPNNGYS